jgi:hypothetical protein
MSRRRSKWVHQVNNFFLEYLTSTVSIRSVSLCTWISCRIIFWKKNPTNIEDLITVNSFKFVDINYRGFRKIINVRGSIRKFIYFYLQNKNNNRKKMLCITFVVLILCKGRRDRMVHTTNVVSLSAARGKMYSIQHYVIKFVSDLRQVGRFLRVLRFPPPTKLIATT